MRYSSVAAAALHAMPRMPVHESVPEKNRGCYVEHIHHDCAVSCGSLGRLCRACHVPFPPGNPAVEFELAVVLDWMIRHPPLPRGLGVEILSPLSWPLALR